MKPEEEENQEPQENTETDNTSPETREAQPSEELENSEDQPVAGQADTKEDTEVKKTEKLNAELAESRDKYLRLYSEFDNYKKRINKERIDLIKSAGSDIITALLPVLDDFERALKSFENTTDVDALKEGINLISVKLKTTLQQKGLKEMESTGQPFDTDLHDALTSIPAPSDDLKGKVIDEVQKGYYLNDKVIRHAKVVIGQ